MYMKAGGLQGDQQEDTPPALPYSDEPKTERPDSLDNPANLFDDSNQRDEVWLRLAQEHLSTRDGSTIAE